MKSDQWFKPGDKVMLVDGTPDELKHIRTPASVTKGRRIPQYGEVLCVEDFFEGPVFNAVMFVGFGGWGHHPKSKYKIGWPAASFRKVEEIRLCLRAASMAQKRKAQEVMP